MPRFARDRGVGLDRESRTSLAMGPLYSTVIVLLLSISAVAHVASMCAPHFCQLFVGTGKHFYLARSERGPRGATAALTLGREVQVRARIKSM